MTPTAIRARYWCAAASVGTQLAATLAGMLPWWGLPLTLPLTVVLAKPPRSIEHTGARVTRGVAVAGVAAFAILIAAKTVAAGSTGADPVATLRSLTEALVVLSLVIEPSARTAREHRVWLTVITGVLVAAAAGGHSRSSAAVTVVSWVVLLLAMAQVQTSAAYAAGAVAAVDRRPTSAVDRPLALPTLWRNSAIVPVFAALVIGGLVFLALPAGLGGGGIARHIAHDVNRGNQSTTATRSTVGVDTSGFGDLSLLVRGALPTTPVLRVPLDSPPLWRGTAYSTYTGTGWNAGLNGPFRFLRAASGSIPPSPDDPRPTGALRTDAVTLANPAQETLIWAPGVPVRLSAHGTGISGISREDANVRVFGRPAGITSYVVESIVASTSPRQLRAATGRDPADPRWTSLPAELPSTVSVLAHQITANSPNRYDAVHAIETYLRSHETYSLNSPVPAAGEDAVADFLFRDHTGFCEQFASAEAVMLRTLGIPSRVVSGLADGSRSGATRLYTAANAHAWVEVYYPGVGWSPSDPTAGSRLAPATSAHRSAVDRALRRGIAALPGGRAAGLGLALVVLVGIGLALGGAMRHHGGSASWRHARRSPIGPVLAAFHRLTGSARAPAPRADHETAREYLSRTVDPGTLDDALATLEQECYGLTPPDDEARDEAIAAFGDLVERHRR